MNVSSPAIYVISPGGRTATGGMCRMVDYFMQEWQTHGRRPPLVMIDSCGPYIKWRMPFYFTAALLRILWDGLLGRIALLHIHTASRGSVARKGILIWLGSLLRIPVLVHMHAADFDQFYSEIPPFAQRLVIATFKRADRFIVLGNAWRKFFVGIGLDPSKVLIIHNAVPDPDLGKYQQTARYQQNAPICRLVFAGTFHKRKGVSDLIAALSTARLRHAPWHLDIAGNGDQAPYRSQAKESGITDKITFHGWLDSSDMHNLLSISDVMVLPSWQEGLPMIIIEAMAHGLPVISTSVGSITDAVQTGVTGLTVPVGDTKLLANALAELIEHPDMRHAMGKAARSRYEAEFRITSANDKIEAIYAAIIPAA